MPRYFTLQQAERLLPALKEQIEQAITLKRENQSAQKEIQRYNERVSRLGGVLIDRQELLRVRARMDATAMRLREVVESVQQTGILVKDLDIGLVDFPTLLGGREVMLCWRLGEEAIRYWHGAEEGYRGRKEIDQDFLADHRGDPEI